MVKENKMANKSTCAIKFKEAIEEDMKHGTICKTGNAKIINESNTVTYQLYSCPIVKVDKFKKEATLNSCGFSTKTTKDHLNLALRKISSKNIHQKKFHWFINGDKFEDGMKIKVE